MKRLLVCVIALAAIALVLPGVLMMMAMTGGTLDVGGSCQPNGGIVLAGGTEADQLDQAQRVNVAAIVDTGLSLNVPASGILVALATARQESGFRNYANDGRGADLAPDQRGIERSLAFAHDAVGSDHGSLGIFQQQWPWWGEMAELMNPSVAAAKFYERLLRVPGWQGLSVTAAAQAVQRSAHPQAYADDVPAAYALLTGQQPPSAESAASSLAVAGGSCTPVATGIVSYPIAGGSTDLHNFGAAGSMWAHGHTGTDLAAPCGTAVLAATNGTVVIRTDQAWSGNWLVEVSTGAGQLTTWYGHMQSISVVEGQQVAAGQQLGTVGALGNASGCHLHFEVHPHGGGYDEDQIDPSAWLAAHVGQSSVVPAASAQSGTTDPFVLMTANIVHTMSAEAAAGRIRELLHHRLDVLILEEVADRNLTAIVRSAPGSWGVLQVEPGTARGETAIIWNAERFAAIQTGQVLGYRGSPRDGWIPWAILRSTAGATLPVVGVHLPSQAFRDPVRADYYRTMTAAYQQLVLRLTADGFPPVVGGDWNGALNRVTRSWAPVTALEQVGMTTNWYAPGACPVPTSSGGGRIDGFAYPPNAYFLVDQGCLDFGPSDHRPVWVALRGAHDRTS